jgi:hypothetical protein
VNIDDAAGTERKSLICAWLCTSETEVYNSTRIQKTGQDWKYPVGSEMVQFHSSPFFNFSQGRRNKMKQKSKDSSFFTHGGAAVL